MLVAHAGGSDKPKRTRVVAANAPIVEATAPTVDGNTPIVGASNAPMDEYSAYIVESQLRTDQ